MSTLQFEYVQKAAREPPVQYLHPSAALMALEHEVGHGHQPESYVKPCSRNFAWKTPGERPQTERAIGKSASGFLSI